MTTRKKIRLKNYDYSKPGCYFVTICSKNNGDIFGHIVNDKIILNKYGKIVKKIWTEIPEHFQHVELDEYIIMPDHIHGIIKNVCRGLIYQTRVNSDMINHAPTTDWILMKKKGITLGEIIRHFKAKATKQMRNLKGDNTFKIWQRSFYEHIIRNEESLNKIREYIKTNPATWAYDEENPDHIGGPLNSNIMCL